MTTTDAISKIQPTLDKYNWFARPTTICLYWMRGMSVLPGATVTEDGTEIEFAVFVNECDLGFCLTGFLSEIEKVVWAAQDIAGDSPYYVYPNNGGTGVYLIR